MFENEKKAYLILADGTVYSGYSFGCEGQTTGEVVFTTGMTGYQETLTDPCYYGQLVAQTFPLNGNYGTNDEDYTSDKCHLNGYIVREKCDFPSNFRCQYTIDKFLKKQNVVAIYGIDTRSLTRKIRENGVMGGMITTDENYDLSACLDIIKGYKVTDAVKAVSSGETKTLTCDDAKYNVAVIDLGARKNIEKFLLDRKCNVTILPYNVSLEQIKAVNPDGIVISDGPGDPNENKALIDALKSLKDIPTFAVCLGHLVLALANDIEVNKLKYGHRGANQPVVDTKKGVTYVTTQNNAYAVNGDKITSDLGYVSYVNANDKTCEGIKYTKVPAMSVQFTPTCCGGPLDTDYLFDEFIEMIESKNGGAK